MYLPDERYASAVSFVEGFHQALDRVPLDGFQAFVSRRLVGGYSPIQWAYLIAETRAPGVRLDHLPAEIDVELTDLLVDLLEEFDRTPAI